MVLAFFIKLSLITFLNTCLGEEKLELVHVLYRHGDRSPVRSYPLDPYNDEFKYWPEGFGQLTKIGKEMEYKLGTWLRNRYSGFVSKEFSPREVNIISTDYDRTLMSAQCVLASFYFPDPKTRFNLSVPWMPTPIHTSRSGTDIILNVDAACPRVSDEMSKMQALPEVKGFLKDNEKLARYLSNHTGLALGSILELDFLYDTLYIEALYNLTLPSWTNGMMDKLKKVADFSFVISAYTTALKRLRGGPLLGQISEHMIQKSHNNLTEKLFMYSAHDSTVAILMNSMNVFNNITPPYAATVLVELYTIDKKFYVKTFYRNDTNIEEDAILLTVPGCTPVCPLSQWVDLMDYAVPNEWHRECHCPDPKQDAYYIQALTATVSCGILLCIAFGLLIYIAHKRTKEHKDMQYQKLLSEEP